jgi:hypothetical protein
MDSPKLEQLSFDEYYRRYGVEIELNATDGRSRPPGENLPEGIHYVGSLVSRTLCVPVEVNKWHHTHHNPVWVIKPDSSCGLEVCSPVSKGRFGMRNICQVVETLAADSNLSADQRCSLHVHVEVADLTQEELAAVLAFWIKCEAVFMDSMPASRKRNRYCQFLGVSELFEHDTEFTPYQLVNKLSGYKYYSINTYHYNKGKRPTIEFRITEAAACRDSYILKNWVRLILHFVEMAKAQPIPGKYREENQWSSLLWLDPRDVFMLLGFLPGQYNLSPEMEETREWFLGRLVANTLHTNLPGVWTDEARMPAYSEVLSLADALKLRYHI